MQSCGIIAGCTSQITLITTLIYLIREGGKIVSPKKIVFLLYFYSAKINVVYCNILI